MDRWGQYHVRKTRRILDSGEKGIQTRHRSSGLAASMTYALDTDRMGVREGSNKEYAQSQNLGARGGFIESSRPGGFLAIPIGDNTAGVEPRYFRPRDVPGGFVIRTGDPDVALLVSPGLQKKTRGDWKRKSAGAGQKAADAIKGTLQVWFLLVHKVKSTAKRFCTFEPEDKVQADKYIEDWVIRGK
jgi:hypothetical protein